MVNDPLDQKKGIKYTSSQKHQKYINTRLYIIVSSVSSGNFIFLNSNMIQIVLNHIR